MRNKVIPLVKVLWRNHLVEEATWEPELTDEAAVSPSFHLTGMQISRTKYLEGGKSCNAPNFFGLSFTFTERFQTVRVDFLLG